MAWAKLRFSISVVCVGALAACGPDGKTRAPAGTGGGSSIGGSDAGGFDASGGPTDPLPTKPLEWVEVPFPDAKCRDGSTARVEVNASPGSDDLVIFLEGGGSCWNSIACGGNPANIQPLGVSHATGVFDRGNSANPVKDWNMVYVPYCTGDVHAGNRPGSDPGIGPQQFVGYSNFEKFLGRIVPTFPNVKKILHTGYSAGGFGAVFTAELVAKAFPSSVDFTLLSDSAPGMSLAFIPACIQQKKVGLWGFDATFLEECGADCPNPENYLIEYPQHLAKAYPSWRIGFIEAVEDSVIRQAFGYTTSDCNGVTQTPTPMDAATFQSGLLDFRAELTDADGGTSNVGTFYLPGGQHGWLRVADSLYSGAASGGDKLLDWFAAIVNGTAPANVGP